MNKNSFWATRDLSERMDQLDALKNDQHIFTELFDLTEYQYPVEGKLKGMVIAVKDNLDVKGYRTRAGSQVLGKVPAALDATVVKRVRDEGAIILGHTQMTELAYSGIGYNPHYGTPENPTRPGCVPGGSTSGGAVAVALGLSDVALGTDTGGSLRIPAAFCGLVGFKPSQSTVPLDGCLPLSTSLDSIGPIAKDVDTCHLIWKVLSQMDDQPEESDAKTHIIIPENFVFEAIEDRVSELFEKAVLRLESLSIEKKTLPVLEMYKKLPVWHFSAAECRRTYQNQFDIQSSLLDPRVKSRIARGLSISDAEFMQTCEQRNELIDAFSQLGEETILMMPTVVRMPPKFEEIEKDADFDRINLLCLRNTSIANALDACSISIPFHSENDSIGVMLIARNGQDQKLLSLAKQIEALFR